MTSLNDAFSKLKKEQSSKTDETVNTQYQPIKPKKNLFKSNTGANSFPHAKKLTDIDGLEIVNLVDRETDLIKTGHTQQIVGRNHDIQHLLSLLDISNQSVILTGGLGIGKATIIRGLAQKLAKKKQEVPASLTNRPLYQMTLSSLISGNTLVGMKEQKLGDLIRLANAEKAILFISDLETISNDGTGGISQTSSFYQAFTDALNKPDNKMAIIGSMTDDDYQAQIAGHPAFSQHFVTVRINSLNKGDVRLILKNTVASYEKKYQGSTVDPAIVDQLVSLSPKYSSTNEPAASLYFLNRLFIYGIESNNYKPAEQLDLSLLAKSIQQSTGIPVFELDHSAQKRFANLSEILKESIIGQDNAIDSISDIVLASFMGLRPPKKPLGVFLFVGPTGVGKTELAKQLAKQLFGNEDRLLRLDMAKYTNSFDTNKLIGDQSQMIQGDLTAPVLAHPFQIVLLDEFEKADPAVIKLMLPIFDDGLIKDGYGKPVSFRHTIIIATSNAGYGTSGKQLDLDEVFPPELLNRFDNRIEFEPFDQDSLLKLSDLAIAKINADYATRLNFTISDEAKRFIAKSTQSVKYGARELERAYTNNVLIELGKYQAKNMNENGTVPKNLAVNLKPDKTGLIVTERTE